MGIKGGRHLVYPEHTPLTNHQLAICRVFPICATRLAGAWPGSFDGCEAAFSAGGYLAAYCF